MKKLLSLLLCAAMVWTSCNVAQAASLAPDVFAAPSDLPQFRLVPPLRLGRITDYFNASGDVEKSGSGEAKPLVILIQDLHAHYGVQKNICGLLEFLADKFPHSSTPPPPHSPTSPPMPFALAVEGAAGPVDSSLMALFPDAQVKEEAAQFLMREGELTGAEYFAIKRGLPNFLVGAENAEYYILHRDLFRKTIDTREALVKTLSAMQKEISALPPLVYDPELKSFQKKIDAWNNGEMTNEEFIGFLVSQLPPSLRPLKDFPALAAFASNGKLTAQPAALSPEVLRAATAELFTNSAAYLSGEEKKNLSVLAKQTDSTAYYLYVRELIYKHQLFLAAPPDLAAYLEYLHTAQTMGMDRVLHEARELAFRIKLQLAAGDRNGGNPATAGSPQQQRVETYEKNKYLSPPLRNSRRRGDPAVDLVQVEHDLDLLKRMADLQATEDEVRDFAPRLNQFVALCTSLLTAGPSNTAGDRPLNENVIRRLVSSSIDYYVMAMMRNEPMADNTLRLITAGDRDGGNTVAAGSPQQQRVETYKNNKYLSPPLGDSRRHGNPAIADSRPTVAVLVAGGFHTAPLTQILRERNISYLVIAPTVDQISDAYHDLYVKRLSGQLMTEDEILAKMAPPEGQTPGSLGYNLRHAIAFLRPSHSEEPAGLAVGFIGDKDPANVDQILSAVEGAEVHETRLPRRAVLDKVKGQVAQILSVLPDSVALPVLAWLKEAPQRPQPAAQTTAQPARGTRRPVLNFVTIHHRFLATMLAIALFLGLAELSTAAPQTQEAPKPQIQFTLTRIDPRITNLFNQEQQKKGDPEALAAFRDFVRLLTRAELTALLNEALPRDAKYVPTLQNLLQSHSQAPQNHGAITMNFATDTITTQAEIVVYVDGVQKTLNLAGQVKELQDELARKPNAPVELHMQLQQQPSNPAAPTVRLVRIPNATVQLAPNLSVYMPNRQNQVPVHGTTVKEALENLVEGHVRLRETIYTNFGTLWPSMRVTVNGQVVPLSTTLKEGDQISIWIGHVGDGVPAPVVNPEIRATLVQTPSNTNPGPLTVRLLKNVNVTVQLPTPLRQYVANRQDVVPVQGRTVQEALENLVKGNSDLRRNLFTDDGKLRPFVLISVDGQEVPSDKFATTPITEGAKISIIGRVRGGSDAENTNKGSDASPQLAFKIVKPADEAARVVLLEKVDKLIEHVIPKRADWRKVQVVLGDILDSYLQGELGEAGFAEAVQKTLRKFGAEEDNTSAAPKVLASLLQIHRSLMRFLVSEVLRNTQPQDLQRSLTETFHLSPPQARDVVDTLQDELASAGIPYPAPNLGTDASVNSPAPIKHALGILIVAGAGLLLTAGLVSGIGFTSSHEQIKTAGGLFWLIPMALASMEKRGWITRSDALWRFIFNSAMDVNNGFKGIWPWFLESVESRRAAIVMAPFGAYTFLYAIPTVQIGLMPGTIVATIGAAAIYGLYLLFVHARDAGLIGSRPTWASDSGPRDKRDKGSDTSPKANALPGTERNVAQSPQTPVPAKLEPFTKLTPERFMAAAQMWLSAQGKTFAGRDAYDLEQFSRLLAPSTQPGNLAEGRGTLWDIRRLLEQSSNFESACYMAAAYVSAVLYQQNFWRRLVERAWPNDGRVYHNYVEVFLAGELWVIDLLPDSLNKSDMGMTIFPKALLQTQISSGELPWYTSWPERPFLYRGQQTWLYATRPNQHARFRPPRSLLPADLRNMRFDARLNPRTVWSNESLKVEKGSDTLPKGSAGPGTEPAAGQPPSRPSSLFFDLAGLIGMPRWLRVGFGVVGLGLEFYFLPLGAHALGQAVSQLMPGVPSFALYVAAVLAAAVILAAFVGLHRFLKFVARYLGRGEPAGGPGFGEQYLQLLPYAFLAAPSLANVAFLIIRSIAWLLHFHYDATEFARYLGLDRIGILDLFPSSQRLSPLDAALFEFAGERDLRNVSFVKEQPIENAAKAALYGLFMAWLRENPGSEGMTAEDVQSLTPAILDRILDLMTLSTELDQEQNIDHALLGIPEKLRQGVKSTMGLRNHDILKANSHLQDYGHALLESQAQSDQREPDRRAYELDLQADAHLTDSQAIATIDILRSQLGFGNPQRQTPPEAGRGLTQPGAPSQAGIAPDLGTGLFGNQRPRNDRPDRRPGATPEVPFEAMQAIQPLSAENTQPDASLGTVPNLVAQAQDAARAISHLSADLIPSRNQSSHTENDIFTLLTSERSKISKAVEALTALKADNDSLDAARQALKESDQDINSILEWAKVNRPNLRNRLGALENTGNKPRVMRAAAAAGMALLLIGLGAFAFMHAPIFIAAVGIGKITAAVGAGKLAVAGGSVKLAAFPVLGMATPSMGRISGLLRFRRQPHVRPAVRSAPRTLTDVTETPDPFLEDLANNYYSANGQDPMARMRRELLQYSQTLALDLRSFAHRPVQTLANSLLRPGNQPINRDRVILNIDNLLKDLADSRGALRLLSPARRERLTGLLQELRTAQAHFKALEDFNRLTADGMTRDRVYAPSPDGLAKAEREAWNGDAIADVVIVGAGFGGLSAGLEAVHAGLKTVMFESGYVGQSFSDDAMQAVHWMRTDAYESSLVQDGVSSPELVEELGMPNHLARLRAEAQAARDKASEATGHAFMGEPPGSGDPENPHAPVARGELAKHIWESADAFVQKGGFIAERSPVVNVKKVSEGLYMVETANGHVQLARNVIAAPGFVGAEGEFARAFPMVSDLASHHPDKYLSMWTRNDQNRTRDTYVLDGITLDLKEGKPPHMGLILSDFWIGKPEIKSILRELPEGTHITVMGSGESAAKAVIEILNINPKLHVDLFIKSELTQGQLHLPAHHFDAGHIRQAIANPALGDETIKEWKAYETPITQQTARDMQAAAQRGQVTFHILFTKPDQNNFECLLQTDPVSGQVSTQLIVKSPQLIQEYERLHQGRWVRTDAGEQVYEYAVLGPVIFSAIGYDRKMLHTAPGSFADMMVQNGLMQFRNGNDPTMATEIALDPARGNLSSAADLHIFFMGTFNLQNSADNALFGNPVRAKATIDQIVADQQAGVPAAEETATAAPLRSSVSVSGDPISQFITRLNSGLKALTQFWPGDAAFARRWVQMDALVRKVLRWVNPDSRDLTVYYPAAGTDVTGPLAAVDARRYIFSDRFSNWSREEVNDKYWLAIRAQLQAMGATIITLNGLGTNRAHFTFDLIGADGIERPRELIYYLGDAKELVPPELAAQKCDVLYLANSPFSGMPEQYLPTPLSLLKPGGHAIINDLEIGYQRSSLVRRLYQMGFTSARELDHGKMRGVEGGIVVAQFGGSVPFWRRPWIGLQRRLPVVPENSSLWREIAPGSVVRFMDAVNARLNPAEEVPEARFEPSDENPGMKHLLLDIEPDISETTLTSWRKLADNEGRVPMTIQGHTFSARFVVDVDGKMPAGIDGTYFYHQGDLVIVTREPIEVGQTSYVAGFHEAVEAYWMARITADQDALEEGKRLPPLEIRRRAHILAAAEQAVAFGPDILSVHSEQLEQMTPSQRLLFAIQDRSFQHSVLQEYLTQLDYLKALAYEERLRNMAIGLNLMSFISQTPRSNLVQMPEPGSVPIRTRGALSNTLRRLPPSFRIDPLIRNLPEILQPPPEMIARLYQEMPMTTELFLTKIESASRQPIDLSQLETSLTYNPILKVEPPQPQRMSKAFTLPDQVSRDQVRRLLNEKLKGYQLTTDKISPFSPWLLASPYLIARMLQPVLRTLSLLNPDYVSSLGDPVTAEELALSGDAPAFIRDYRTNERTSARSQILRKSLLWAFAGAVASHIVVAAGDYTHVWSTSQVAKMVADAGSYLIAGFSALFLYRHAYNRANPTAPLEFAKTDVPFSKADIEKLINKISDQKFQLSALSEMDRQTLLSLLNAEAIVRVEEREIPGWVSGFAGISFANFMLSLLLIGVGSWFNLDNILIPWFVISTGIFGIGVFLFAGYALFVNLFPQRTVRIATQPPAPPMSWMLGIFGSILFGFGLNPMDVLGPYRAVRPYLTLAGVTSLLTTLKLLIANHKNAPENNTSTQPPEQKPPSQDTNVTEKASAVEEQMKVEKNIPAAEAATAAGDLDTARKDLRDCSACSIAPVRNWQTWIEQADQVDMKSTILPLAEEAGQRIARGESEQVVWDDLTNRIASVLGFTADQLPSIAPKDVARNINYLIDLLRKNERSHAGESNVIGLLHGTERTLERLEVAEQATTTSLGTVPWVRRVGVSALAAVLAPLSAFAHTVAPASTVAAHMATVAQAAAHAATATAAPGSEAILQFSADAAENISVHLQAGATPSDVVAALQMIWKHADKASLPKDLQGPLWGTHGIQNQAWSNLTNGQHIPFRNGDTVPLHLDKLPDAVRQALNGHVVHLNETRSVAHSIANGVQSAVNAPSSALTQSAQMTNGTPVSLNQPVDVFHPVDTSTWLQHGLQTLHHWISFHPLTATVAVGLAVMGVMALVYFLLRRNGAAERRSAALGAGALTAAILMFVISPAILLMGMLPALAVLLPIALILANRQTRPAEQPNQNIQEVGSTEPSEAAREDIRNHWQWIRNQEPKATWPAEPTEADIQAIYSLGKDEPNFLTTILTYLKDVYKIGQAAPQTSPETQTVRAPTTLNIEAVPIPSGEFESLRNRIHVQVDGDMDSQDLLSKFPPKHKINFNGVTYYLAAPYVSAENKRPAFMVYIYRKNPATDEEEIFSRVLYKSNSQKTVWRFASHKGGHWIGKGLGQETTDAPLEIISTVSALRGLYERQPGGLPVERGFYEVLEEHGYTVPDGFAKSMLFKTTYLAAAARGKIPPSERDKRPVIEIGKFKDGNNPGSYVANEGFEPDFANGIIEIFDDEDTLSGPTRAYRVRSVNGQAEYLFIHELTGRGRVEIGSIQVVDPRVTRFGVKANRVMNPEMGRGPGSLLMPANEYFKEIPEAYRGEPVGGSYYDSSKFLELLPPIRQFRRDVLHQDPFPAELLLNRPDENIPVNYSGNPRIAKAAAVFDLLYRTKGPYISVRKAIQKEPWSLNNAEFTWEPGNTGAEGVDNTTTAGPAANSLGLRGLSLAQALGLPISNRWVKILGFVLAVPEALMIGKSVGPAFFAHAGVFTSWVPSLDLSQHPLVLAVAMAGFILAHILLLIAEHRARGIPLDAKKMAGLFAVQFIAMVPYLLGHPLLGVLTHLTYDAYQISKTPIKSPVVPGTTQTQVASSDQAQEPEITESPEESTADDLQFNPLPLLQQGNGRFSFWWHMVLLAVQFRFRDIALIRSALRIEQSGQSFQEIVDQTAQTPNIAPFLISLIPILEDQLRTADTAQLREEALSSGRYIIASLKSDSSLLKEFLSAMQSLKRELGESALSKPEGDPDRLFALRSQEVARLLADEAEKAMPADMAAPAETAALTLPRKIQAALRRISRDIGKGDSVVSLIGAGAAAGLMIVGALLHQFYWFLPALVWGVTDLTTWRFWRTRFGFSRLRETRQTAFIRNFTLWRWGLLLLGLFLAANISLAIFNTPLTSYGLTVLYSGFAILEVAHAAVLQLAYYKRGKDRHGGTIGSQIEKLSQRSAGRALSPTPVSTEPGAETQEPAANTIPADSGLGARQSQSHPRSRPQMRPDGEVPAIPSAVPASPASAAPEPGAPQGQVSHGPETKPGMTRRLFSALGAGALAAPRSAPAQDLTPQNLQKPRTPAPLPQAARQEPVRPMVYLAGTGMGSNGQGDGNGSEGDNVIPQTFEYVDNFMHDYPSDRTTPAYLLLGTLLTMPGNTTALKSSDLRKVARIVGGALFSDPHLRDFQLKLEELSKAKTVNAAAVQIALRETAINYERQLATSLADAWKKSPKAFGAMRAKAEQSDPADVTQLTDLISLDPLLTARSENLVIQWKSLLDAIEKQLLQKLVDTLLGQSSTSGTITLPQIAVLREFRDAFYEMGMEKALQQEYGIQLSALIQRLDMTETQRPIFLRLVIPTIDQIISALTDRQKSRDTLIEEYVHYLNKRGRVMIKADRHAQMMKALPWEPYIRPISLATLGRSLSASELGVLSDRIPAALEKFRANKKNIGYRLLHLKTTEGAIITQTIEAYAKELASNSWTMDLGDENQPAARFMITADQTHLVVQAVYSEKEDTPPESMQWEQVFSADADMKVQFGRFFVPGREEHSTPTNRYWRVLDEKLPDTQSRMYWDISRNHLVFEWNAKSRMVTVYDNYSQAGARNLLPLKSSVRVSGPLTPGQPYILYPADTSLTRRNTYLPGAIRKLLGEKTLALWQTGDATVKQGIEEDLRVVLSNRLGEPYAGLLVGDEFEKALDRLGLKREIENNFAGEWEWKDTLKWGFLRDHRILTDPKAIRDRLWGLWQIRLATVAPVIIGMGIVAWASFADHSPILTLVMAAVLVWIAGLWKLPKYLNIKVHDWHNRTKPYAVLTLSSDLVAAYTNEVFDLTKPSPTDPGFGDPAGANALSDILIQIAHQALEDMLMAADPDKGWAKLPFLIRRNQAVKRPMNYAVTQVKTAIFAEYYPGIEEVQYQKGVRLLLKALTGEDPNAYSPEGAEESKQLDTASLLASTSLGRNNRNREARLQYVKTQVGILSQAIKDRQNEVYGKWVATFIGWVAANHKENDVGDVLHLYLEATAKTIDRLLDLGNVSDSPQYKLTSGQVKSSEEIISGVLADMGEIQRLSGIKLKKDLVKIFVNHVANQSAIDRNIGTLRTTFAEKDFSKTTNLLKSVRHHSRLARENLDRLEGAIEGQYHSGTAARERRVLAGYADYPAATRSAGAPPGLKALMLKDIQGNPEQHGRRFAEARASFMKETGVEPDMEDWRFIINLTKEARTWDKSGEIRGQFVKEQADQKALLTRPLIPTKTPFEMTPVQGVPTQRLPDLQPGQALWLMGKQLAVQFSVNEDNVIYVRFSLLGQPRGEKPEYISDWIAIPAQIKTSGFNENFIFAIQRWKPLPTARPGPFIDADERITAGVYGETFADRERIILDKKGFPLPEQGRMLHVVKAVPIGDQVLTAYTAQFGAEIDAYFEGPKGGAALKDFMPKELQTSAPATAPQEVKESPRTPVSAQNVTPDMAAAYRNLATKLLLQKLRRNYEDAALNGEIPSRYVGDVLMADLQLKGWVDLFISQHPVRTEITSKSVQADVNTFNIKPNVNGAPAPAVVAPQTPAPAAPAPRIQAAPAQEDLWHRDAIHFLTQHFEHLKKLPEPDQITDFLEFAGKARNSKRWTSLDEVAFQWVSTYAAGSALRRSWFYTVFMAGLVESGLMPALLLHAQQLTQSPFVFAVTAALVFFAMHIPQLYMGEEGRANAGKSFLQRVKTLGTPEILGLTVATFAVGLILPGLHAANPNYAQGALAFFAAAHTGVNFAKRWAQTRARFARLFSRLNVIGRWREERREAAARIAEAESAVQRAGAEEQIAVPGIQAYSPTIEFSSPAARAAAQAAAASIFTQA